MTSPINTLRPLAIDETVSHREDTVYSFDGVVTDIDEGWKTYYTVRWADGSTEVYDRFDLVAKDDPDGAETTEVAASS
jgi:hypothetical protein